MGSSQSSLKVKAVIQGTHQPNEGGSEMESGRCWSRVFKHPFNYLLFIAFEAHGTISSTLLYSSVLNHTFYRPFVETKTIRVGRFKTPSTQHSPQEQKHVKNPDREI